MVKAFKRLIKSMIWRKRNTHNLTTLVGDNFPLDKVVVGRMTYGPIHAISFGASDERLKIGNFCSIADKVTFLMGGGHSLDLLSTYPFRSKLIGCAEAKSKGPIVLEDDVWIGYGATVLSGVTLGRGCVVGAGALVCNDVPPYAIAVGVPAKVIRYRFDEATRSRLSRIDLERLNVDFVRKEIDLFELPITKETLSLLESKLEYKS